MLGFGDVGVAAAYLACLAATALCVVSGLMHWNEDDTAAPRRRRHRDADAAAVEEEI
jgi:hypothetical protein